MVSTTLAPGPTSRRRPLSVGQSEIAAVTSSALAKVPRGLEPRVVALVPAHNEADTIELALTSLERQSHRPDPIVVIADNCTDATADVVRNRGGAVVVASDGNEHKKAGALNQVLEQIMPEMTDDDAVLVMDADSMLHEDFLRAALGRLSGYTQMRRRAQIGGVGGTFHRGRGGGFVGMLQRNEHARYARDVRRLKGRVLVLTGTAAVFSVGALRDVMKGRVSGRLPGRIPQVYGTEVLTEDNELTVALLPRIRRGQPEGVPARNEVMTTWRRLWKQQVRWKRGALENLFEYGLTRITLRYWGRQVLTHLGVLITAVYLGTLLLTLAVYGTVHLHPLWLCVTVIFVVERAVSVNKRGWLQMVIAAVLVVEMAFDIFLQAAQLRALWDAIFDAESDW
jgi:cellulose synthase/poly-beta-1,6-N-acetylglucosamine synthase-like glycosyltransferase